MLFGPKFYVMLEKLTVWRQSLFALVLATRQYPHFALWCEIHERQGKTEYLEALKKCWEYHYDKFNHIDLGNAFSFVEPYLPLELEEYNEGDSFAFDTAVMLGAALDSIPLNTKEAVDASKASMASVIRLCELKHPEQAQDEESLLELPEIEAELDYQVELLELVQKPRSQNNVRALLELALRDNVSNIGLENPLTLEDFASCFTATYQDMQDRTDATLPDGEVDASADASAASNANASAEGAATKPQVYKQGLKTGAHKARGGNRGRGGHGGHNDLNGRNGRDNGHKA